jgi:hypothetical protein
LFGLGWFFTVLVQWNNITMIEQVAQNKSSLILTNILQNAQILQLFTKRIKTESTYESN